MTSIRSLLAALIIVAAGPALSQTSQSGSSDRAYPDRPIRYVIPYLAGSSIDVAGRIVAQKLSESLGQPVVVENRAGAGGNLGAEFVAKATPTVTRCCTPSTALRPPPLCTRTSGSIRYAI